MIDYISDITWWEIAAKFAPIATASIALLAALIALGAIWAQMIIARRRAAIDFFLKMETDERVIEWYSKFKAHDASITSIPPPLERKDYEDVRAFLNICELIAVGIRKGAFSESISYAYWGDIIPNTYQSAKELITNIRKTPGEGLSTTYVDLEELAERWTSKGTVGGSMKRLNFWRGLWRVWVIGTVAWAAWTFWDSDPQCLIYLVKPSVQETGSVTLPMPPWCYYRDFKYYLELLSSMFGWPVLIGILLLALRWAIAGFSKKEGTQAKEAKAEETPAPTS